MKKMIAGLLLLLAAGSLFFGALLHHVTNNMDIENNAPEPGLLQEMFGEAEEVAGNIVGFRLERVAEDPKEAYMFSIRQSINGTLLIAEYTAPGDEKKTEIRGYRIGTREEPQWAVMMERMKTFAPLSEVPKTAEYIFVLYNDGNPDTGRFVVPDPVTEKAFYDALRFIAELPEDFTF